MSYTKDCSPNVTEEEGTDDLLTGCFRLQAPGYNAVLERCLLLLLLLLKNMSAISMNRCTLG